MSPRNGLQAALQRQAIAAESTGSGLSRYRTLTNNEPDSPLDFSVWDWADVGRLGGEAGVLHGYGPSKTRLHLGDCLTPEKAVSIASSRLGAQTRSQAVAPMRATCVTEAQLFLLNTPVRDEELRGYHIWRQQFAIGEAGVF